MHSMGYTKKKQLLNGKKKKDKTVDTQIQTHINADTPL